jgi:very-short-patch-repair endonuclease
VVPVDQLIRDAIARLRLKLLDLTNRNRLLNFKFTDSSKKYVRVIDEIPGHLYDKLTSDSASKLYFAALPEPPEDDVDPDDTGVRIRRLAPAVSPVAAGGDGVTNQETGEATERANTPRFNLAQWARENGIEASYDLPEQGTTDIEKKYLDNQIQTLLLPDMLSKKMARIRDDARLVEQEQGTSTLYAAFGFLEWYEDPHSAESRYAPLFLLPVQLSREIRGQQYCYFIECGEGTDPTINISLRERLLRDFGFALPALEEDQGPEQYLASVRHAIEPLQRWRVRRFVVIGHFSFARLAMYEDLDPDKWTEAPLEEQSLIRDLLAGAETGSADSYAEDFETESEEIEKLVPALILDADSSQYSAIVDAMQGRSFALKGPPGTGKSQTITNLIAAAIAANKRVLFVAEKLAALEVVSKRLSEAGLGPFTLELHSTKVQKKKVAQAFEERLAIRKPPTVHPGAFSTHPSELKQVRNLLHRYSNLLNSPVGLSDMTLHDVLWHEQRSRGDLDEREHAISSLMLERDQTQKNNSGVSADLEAIRLLTDGIAAATEIAGSLPKYPLYGLRHLSPDLSEQARTRQELRVLETAVQGLQSLADRLTSRLRIVIAPSLGALTQFTQSILEIPVPEAIRPELLMAIRNVEEAARVAQLIDQAQAARIQVEQLDTVIEGVYGGLGSAAQRAADSARLKVLAQRLEWGEQRLDAAGSKLEQQEAELKRARDLLLLLNKWAMQLGLVVPLRISTVESLVSAIELLHQTAAGSLRHRHTTLFRAEARTDIAAAKTICQSLNVEEQDLAREAQLSFHESPGELTAAANVIQNAGIGARLFSPAYRRAKQFFQGLSREPWQRLEAPSRLQRWAAAINRRQEFENSATFRHKLGPAFTGMQTPLDTLSGVVNYWEAARAGWPLLDEEKGKIQRGLLTAAAALLEDASSSFSSDDLALLKSVQPWAASSDTLLADDIFGNRSAYLAQARSSLTALTAIPWRQMATIDAAATLCQKWSSLASLIRELGRSPSREIVLPNSRVPGAAEITCLQATTSLAMAVLQSKLPLEAIQLLLSPKSLEAMRALQQYATAITQGVDRVRTLVGDLKIGAGLVIDDWATGATLDAVELAVLQNRAAAAAGAPPEYYADWASLCEAHRGLVEQGAGALAAAVIRGEIRAKRAEQCYRRLYYRSLIHSVGEQCPEFRAWTGNKMHYARRQLVDLDLAHIKSSTKRLIQKLESHEVPVGVSRGAKKDLTERSLIENEVGKQTRHIPIRSLLARAFHAAQALKPCFMMSPASVSQFLSQVPGVFDLVVIDEASQMRPEDALAALARGKQLVVVGDPMQLPPTTFFDSVQDDTPADDDGDELAVDTESILDLGLSQLRPARDLRWHYRSRHESLIAFSNREFYLDRLIVFPSPVAKANRLGVQYVLVDNGYYKASLNPNEAAEVVKIVAAIIRESPNRSIGVVAVNQPQRDLLADEFDRMFAQDETLEAYRAHWSGTLEAFFVNNLENVQGHERDVIVISTVYGPETPGGPVFQRFGPINSKMGHRRLNVLFTRAKEHVVLVTSLKSEDIRVLPTSPPGVTALKNYLEFARSGRLDSGIATGRSQDSPFESEVADLLTQLGYRVQPQVGVAGFFIDMAVRHPARQDHYVLGIECDGATYHSARSARDRDRLRQEILERLGWNLHRIWSTDWYQGRDREVARLKQAVSAAIGRSL